MTTTIVFQGKDEGAKNTSRVLQPPGGGSSIIFGGGDDTTAHAPAACPPAPAQPTAPPGPPAGTSTPDKTESTNVESSRNRLYGGGSSEKVKTRVGGNPKNMGSRGSEYDHMSCAPRTSRSLFSPPPSPVLQGKATPKGYRDSEFNPITGDSPRHRYSPASSPARLGKGTCSSKGFNPITGEPLCPTTPTDKENNNGLKDVSGGTFNPISGQELVAPKEQKPVHTTTRVRQPPGGASSGIW